MVLLLDLLLVQQHLLRQLIILLLNCLILGLLKLKFACGLLKHRPEVRLLSELLLHAHEPVLLLHHSRLVNLHLTDLLLELSNFVSGLAYCLQLLFNLLLVQIQSFLLRNLSFAQVL